MKQNLSISDDFSLPIEAVTQTFSVLAKRGSGKTYAAAVMAEEMLAAGQQVVAIDPTGSWFGLRSSSDGKSPGYPIVVLGGDHADVPLEEHAGELVASAIVERRFSAVLDLSLFRKGQMIRFMTAFAETLYRTNREPLHLFVDEADAVAPQGRNYGGGEENRMLGAMEDLVRRGRKRGIGCTLITQRPAVLNKSVLTQCETLLVLRLVHPRDIDAIEEWVNVHAEPAALAEVVGSLPSLRIGEGWIWSPGWLDVLKKIRIRRRHTFDSSATPKPGEKVKVPSKLAPVDVEALGEAIRATVQRAKDSDPSVLRHRIADLEAKLKAAVIPKPFTVVEKKNVLKDSQITVLASQIEKMVVAAGKIDVTAKNLEASLKSAWMRRDATSNGQPLPASQRPIQSMPAARHRVAEQFPEINGKMVKAERMILACLAQHRCPMTKARIAVATGYAVNGGGFNNAIGALRSKGFVASVGDSVEATEAGLRNAGDVQPLPSGAALIDYWKSRLPKAEKTILSAVVSQYPRSMTKEEIAQQTGYEVGGGGFNNALGKLRTLELVHGRSAVSASSHLFT